MKRRRTPPKTIRFSVDELAIIKQAVEMLKAFGKETNPHKFMKEAIMERVRGLMT